MRNPLKVGSQVTYRGLKCTVHAVNSRYEGHPTYDLMTELGIIPGILQSEMDSI